MSGDPRAIETWDDYVAGFHDERPGITEELLGRSVDGNDETAYQWVAEGLSGVVVDIGCGTGPVQAARTGWIGLDRSRAELDGARRRGRGPLVAGSAGALPLRGCSVDAVVAAMSLMVIDRPARALDEVRRILRPGGELRVLLPADRPLTTADRFRYALLLAAVGRTALPFPRPEVVADPGRLLADAGFAVVADERRRYAFAVADRSDADHFVASLYLPGISDRRIRVARAVTRAWGHDAVGIPLRRVTARVTDRAAALSRPRNDGPHATGIAQSR